MSARDHYGDGVWYDAEYVHMRADIPYYERVARETDGTILELACGTGRLTFPMASAGAEVLGIDIASPMIERAHAKRAELPGDVQRRVAFRVGDMRKIRIGRKFDAVVLAFNTLMHMIEDDDLVAALETAREHLAVDGRFHFDLHTPYPKLPDRDPDARYDPQQMIDPRTGDRYVVSENHDYDARRQLNTMSFFYRRADANGEPHGPEERADLTLRVLFPRELDYFLRQTGFEVVGDFDDFERSVPFSGRGGRRVVIAKKR